MLPKATRMRAALLRPAPLRPAPLRPAMLRPFIEEPPRVRIREYKTREVSTPRAPLCRRGHFVAPASSLLGTGSWRCLESNNGRRVLRDGRRNEKEPDDRSFHSLLDCHSQTCSAVRRPSSATGKGATGNDSLHAHAARVART